MRRKLFKTGFEDPLTRREIGRLTNGDEVFWADPDGETSRYIIIRQVTINGEVISVYGQDGDYLECMEGELY